MRRPLIAGNWKMNTSHREAVALASEIAAETVPGVDLVVCPPAPWLVPVRDAVATSGVAIGAQNCWPRPNGAFTGEVSLAMLAELCAYVIVGHSERRQILGESDALVRENVSAVLDAVLTPILCVGETLETRQADDAESFVATQLDAALDGRSAEQIAAIVVAYEPIWAIGTGVAASATDAETMSAFIRGHVDSLQAGSGDAIRILYGGSVTPANSAETLGQPNVDGALVGGASLKSASFLEIARSAVR
ncbi:MAG: triose-phosphate isomerase [Thermomicrobiales bacterium]|nr:triose-phosphate isomerase [Thermomicrobiales bacterium]